MNKLFKCALLGMSILIPSCSSGGGGVDDNNVLLYKKDQNYLFKGTLCLGIYDRPEAASIFDIQKEQKSPAPDEVRNDCIVAASKNIASLVVSDDGTITIPLYDSKLPIKNLPLDYLVNENEGSIKGRKYTFLKKENNEFYWALNSDERFFLYFAPAYQSSVTCFRNLIYDLKIDYSFIYYVTSEMREIDRREINKKIEYKNEAKTCYNNSVINENLDSPFPNKKVSEVYAPVLKINSISGTIDPVFSNPGEEGNINKYIKKKLASNLEHRKCNFQQTSFVSKIANLECKTLSCYKNDHFFDL